MNAFHPLSTNSLKPPSFLSSIFSPNPFFKKS